MIFKALCNYFVNTKIYTLEKSPQISWTLKYLYYLCVDDYNRNMEIKFDKKYLEELYLEGKASDKKHRFQPPIVAKYRKTIDILESVSAIEDLFRYQALQYKALEGDKAGLESVRVNDQYRIEFKTTKVVSEVVVTVCNIIELSNHYK